MRLAWIAEDVSRHDVIEFADMMRRQLSLEGHGQGCVDQVFNSHETALMLQRLLNEEDNDIANAYRERLELDKEFYTGVRQNLMALLQLWDAVTDEKDRFDRGAVTEDTRFKLSFLLCTDLVPNRVNMGALGPTWPRVSALDRNDLSHEVSPSEVDNTTDKEDEGYSEYFFSDVEGYEEISPHAGIGSESLSTGVLSSPEGPEAEADLFGDLEDFDDETQRLSESAIAPQKRGREDFADHENNGRPSKRQRHDKI